MVKRRSAKQLAAEACAKIWKVVEAVPLLKALERNAYQLWGKSKLLNHPYVQLKRGFVFIHVPKTGGNSISKALGLSEDPRDTSHNRAKDVMPFVKVIAPHVVAITFVRNPYTRFLSLYNYARLEESLFHSVSKPETALCGVHPDYHALRASSLEQCAELLVASKLGDVRGAPTLWHPQFEWLLGWDGKVMVDYIAKIETVQADLAKMKELYGIESGPVPWLNKSERKGPPPQLTPRAIDLLRLYYQRDFELLGYDEKVIPEEFEVVGR
jgi:hypothetical protein